MAKIRIKQPALCTSGQKRSAFSVFRPLGGASLFNNVTKDFRLPDFEQLWPGKNDSDVKNCTY
jgi:hypothetical protein